MYYQKGIMNTLYQSTKMKEMTILYIYAGILHIGFITYELFNCVCVYNNIPTYVLLHIIHKYITHKYEGKCVK